jgi:ABC-type Fe3+/spermidine/putrescine transport system ATPase subunit
MSALPDLNSTSKPAISLRNVYKSFDNDGEAQTVLHDISIDFPAGAMSYVVGPSGCGKTTLISIIAGILTRRYMPLIKSKRASFAV